MSQRTIIACDECGAEKQKTNGWSKVWTASTGVFCALHGHNPNLAPEYALDFCGRECAQRAYERYLSTGDIAKTDASSEGEKP